MNEARIEQLGAGWELHLTDFDDGTTRVVLVNPDGLESCLVSGNEIECPEDMTWQRDLGPLFRAGLRAGMAIGRAKEAP